MLCCQLRHLSLLTFLQIKPPNATDFCNYCSDNYYTITHMYFSDNSTTTATVSCRPVRSRFPGARQRWTLLAAAPATLSPLAAAAVTPLGEVLLLGRRRPLGLPFGTATTATTRRRTATTRRPTRRTRAMPVMRNGNLKKTELTVNS